MKFCIIGDSWTGWTPDPEDNRDSDMYLQVMEQYLNTHGHIVTTNISQCGASNFGQLRMLEYNVNFNDFDYIIWLYTEPSRNLTEFIGTNDLKIQYPELSFKNFYKDLEYVQHRDFLYAQRLFKKHKKPFIVIGGAGQINTGDIEYPFISWLLPSWNKEISKLEPMPVNCYVHHTAILIESTQFDYNKQEILTELDNLKNLTTLMKNNQDLYHDEHHPSPHLYESLLERMLMQMEEK
jgi:hypothetical protein